MSNTKLNVQKKVLQEVCEKFNRAKQYIKERTEELCSESKLSIDEVTYLFTKILRLLLKSYNYHLSVIILNVINLIFLHYAELRSEGCNLRDQKTKLEITKDLGYGQLTTKVKYFRCLDQTNDLLTIWFQNLK